MIVLLSEFAYMSKVTTKVDVFSFGIIVMELLTKQRPTGLTEMDVMSMSLSELVANALENGTLLQILDPTLALNISREQEEVLEELFKLALICTHSNPDVRPNMKDVLSTLLKLNKV